jgi:hypothetical protein
MCPQCRCVARAIEKNLPQEIDFSCKSTVSAKRERKNARHHTDLPLDLLRHGDSLGQQIPSALCI